MHDRVPFGFRFSMLVLGSLASAGCAASTTVAGSGYCAPPTGLSEFAAESDPLPPRGSGREEFMAAMVGLRQALSERARDERTRLLVLERIEAAKLAISSTSAELDCEAKRTSQAAAALARRQSSEVQTLTIASIAAAAATGLASVFASTGGGSAWTQNGIAIGGGAVTAGFGVASLYVQPTLWFNHPHNLLADVWFGPSRSSVYPSLVWGYLTIAEFSNDQSAPIREKLAARWRHFQRIDDDAQTVELLFGAGGAYDLDTLRTRESMLEEVRAEVELGNQELAALAARLRPRIDRELARPTTPVQ